MQSHGLSVGQPTSDFLGNLAEDDRTELYRLGKHREYRKGSAIFRVGDTCSHVYFLEAGRVKIFQPSSKGREVILWFCLGGEIFGLAEAARGGRRVVGATACEDVVVLTVTDQQFKQFVLSRPSAALLSMQVLASRLRGLSDVLVNFVSDEVDIRIAKLILRLGARYGQRRGNIVHLDIPLTHQEIADMVGTTRQTVTAVLSRLRKERVLSIDSHCIDVESEKELSELAQ